MESFSVSARGKNLSSEIGEFLRHNFEMYHGRIESVFGFVEHIPLYGGRPFIEREISDQDVEELKLLGIGLRLPLTNHFVTHKDYLRSKPFLAKYHDKKNSVITVSDELASWIRQDFPLYTIEASVIKDLKTLDAIHPLFEIYDQVVLHGSWNLKTTELATIEQKDRIRLFTNMGCSLNCPAKICYPSFSKFNNNMSVFDKPVVELLCSQPLIKREVSLTEFDLNPLIKLGFTKFKALRSKGITGF